MSVATEKIIHTRAPRLPVYRAGRRGRIKPLKRECNLCQREFLAHTQFDRFCSACRQGSELFHYYESMPQLEVKI